MGHNCRSLGCVSSHDKAKKWWFDRRDVLLPSAWWKDVMLTISVLAALVMLAFVWCLLMFHTVQEISAVSLVRGNVFKEQLD